MDLRNRPIRKSWRMWKRDALHLLRSGIRAWKERAWAPGTMIAGRYIITRKLGMGSYGVAYLCEDNRTKEACVLKGVYALNGDKRRSAIIYSRETGILSRLNHPGIPRLIDKLDFHGMSCLVMEHIPGRTLDEWLFGENAGFTETEALCIVRKLLHIVQYIHQEGFVHRDISIANIMLKDEAVRLIDFGLAVSLNEQDPSASSGKEDTLDDDPMEKKLRRKADVSSDFYAIGHLLLFLLYSTYDEEHQNPRSAEEADQGWVTELDIHPLTRRLLLRLLQSETPFGRVDEVTAQVELALAELSSPS
jgi:serine/threonine protein kinase, bacterial